TGRGTPGEAQTDKPASAALRHAYRKSTLQRGPRHETSPLVVQVGAHARSSIKLARPCRPFVFSWLRPGIALPSPHRRPGSVRIATSVAAGDLRLTIDIDGVSVRSALQPIRLIGRPRNHRSIATGIRILPRHGDARLSGFERLHLRRIRAPLVIVVHAGADAIADQTAKRCAGEAGCDALAGSTAELRSDQTARNRADERARILFRSLAGL